MRKTSAIIQARTGSTRLPNKIFMKVGNKILIERVVNCLKKVDSIDEIIIATTTNEVDHSIVNWCKHNSVLCFQGDESNVLKRYYNCALEYQSTNIIRITADDPFKDPDVINKMVVKFNKENLDFLCNNNPPTFPEGLDVEIFSMNTLKTMYSNAHNDFQREHVTQYCHQNRDLFKFDNYANKEDYSVYRLTIDTIKDLEFCNNLCNSIPGLEKENLPFSIIVDYLNNNQQLIKEYLVNNRSEMYR